MKVINSIVVGFGHLGKWHVQKAKQITETRLLAVIERDISNQQKCKLEHPGIKIFSDIQSCIDFFEIKNIKIDAAIVVTPTSTHRIVVEELLNNNIHCFCEKPLADLLSDAIFLEKLAIDKKCLLQVGHSERFHEAFEIHLDLISKYISGKSIIKCVRVAPFKGRAQDVDVISDLMIHDLDLLNVLIKEKPINVKAKGLIIRTEKIDYIEAELEYKNGIKAYLTAGRNNTHERREINFINSNGHLKIDLLNLKIIEASSTESVKEIVYTKRDHLLIEQTKFYNSILNDLPPVVSGKDGVDVVRLISKILEVCEI